MGVVNVTPDSFSDGGRWFDHAAAVEHGRQLIAEGADIVDVGGESTRPGSAPVDEAEELRRVIPVAAGIDPAQIWIDPGIGFGKRVGHNLSLLRHLRTLVGTGWPVAVGASRKWFIGQLTGGAPAEDRLEGSLALASWAAAEGAVIV